MKILYFFAVGTFNFGKSCFFTNAKYFIKIFHWRFLKNLKLCFY